MNPRLLRVPLEVSSCWPASAMFVTGAERGPVWTQTLSNERRAAFQRLAG